MTAVTTATTWDDERGENATQRADRNWSELLQELRVTQTGTQILTAFLLTVPFQARFAELSSRQVWIYLALVACAVVATAFVLAPVVVHRALFARRRKPDVVRIADRLARIGLTFLGLALVGTAHLLADVVLGATAGISAGGAVLVLLIVLWVVLPWRLRRLSPRLGDPDDDPPVDPDGGPGHGPAAETA